MRMADFTHEFFEEASAEFMRGKLREGHMIYYKCKNCKKKAVQDVFADEYLCKYHTRSKKQIPNKVDELPKLRRSARLSKTQG